MGRLQDKQYSKSRHSKTNERDEQKNQQGRSKLQAIFCPPLDPSLIAAIWSDTHNYEQSFHILSELAKQTEDSVDPEQKALEQLQLDETPTGDPNCHDDHDDDEDDDENGYTTPSSTDKQEIGDGVEFLMRCFPDHDRVDLVEALELQDGDVEKATDLLLNRVFLDNENEENSASDKEISMPDTKDKTPIKKVKARKPKKVVWSSGALPSSSSQVPTDAENGYHMATLPFNYWHQYDKQIDKIQKVFPKMAHTTVLRCVQRCRGDVVAAIVMLMEKEPGMNPVLAFEAWRDIRTLEKVQQGIQTILVDRPADLIRRVAVGVMVDTGNSEIAVDTLVQEGIDFILTYDQRQKALMKRREQMMMTQTSLPRTIPQANDMPVIPEYLLLDNRGLFAEDDPELCRDIAWELIMQRNELYRKAAASYQRAKNKRSGESGVAFFYSQEARECDEKAKHWNMRAARSFVRQERLRKNDDHLLDLHGLTVAEAQVLIKEGVSQWWSRSQMQAARRAIQPLRIITGVGNHSSQHRSRLFPSALKFLKKEGWRTELPSPGCILVKGPMK
ncbi:uncharacterized protein BYT42DRAFT_86996 [Radiomyces spectabilis]|uniref:uncharacterized protein n=1 Tax=Radiomyces spectabilis TaxID=64574 RepID=UPI00221FBC8E|nr:uncharacterized protein BYT42DRAFT_86996 [Radiomyces spectabilis]KAI8370394.1 hypothetical protein BYT42DRAFT_86996 [Radiomyces spectabilis]